MIHVKDLSKSFGSCLALDRVSFDVQQGEVVGMLGPNGAGKTTCLRILTCFVPASSGEVRILGLDPARDSVAIRRQVGYLPEGVPLYPELRVREYLDFRVRLRGIPKERRREIIERVVNSCGIEEVVGRLVGQLSRGFRQRLGLADALLGSPPLLILDEPTVGLDPNQIRQVRQLILSLAGEHTILLSTHRLDEVEAVCSRALILHQGRLVAQGSLDQLCRQESLERVFARHTAGEAQT
jgi:ABC-2 type transport system ATP-binding protein